MIGNEAFGHSLFAEWRSVRYHCEADIRAGFDLKLSGFCLERCAPQRQGRVTETSDICHVLVQRIGFHGNPNRYGSHRRYKALF
jgi:hypothetical protein